MPLPRKLKRAKMGVRTPLRRVWPRHRRWVKSHGCCVNGCPMTPIEFAHLRSAANAGMATKPHDAFGISLCRTHHGEQHRLGAARFAQKYQLDLWALAAEFARRSPDHEMKASLALVAEHNLSTADRVSVARGKVGATGRIQGGRTT
jgi:hypothetical protein